MITEMMLIFCDFCPVDMCCVVFSCNNESLRSLAEAYFSSLSLSYFDLYYVVLFCVVLSSVLYSAAALSSVIMMVTALLLILYPLFSVII